MKKFIIALTIALVGFANIAYGSTDMDYGWKPVVNAEGKTVGMSNVGEQGGLLNLVCDVKSHNLKLTYSMGATVYDMFVFRKFGITNMNESGNAGKFVVGTGTTSQADVFYNVLVSDKAFVIARFPIGSKSAWDKAVATNAANGPDIRQEGDETFLAGDTWKPLLKSLSVECPFKADDKTPIF
jgi:hypothetical protein